MTEQTAASSLTRRPHHLRLRRAPFTLLGGRARMESIFGGRERLSAIVDELNQLIIAA